MPIPFVCPHCGVSMHVDPAYAGQSGPCSGCGQKIEIPAPSEDLPPFAPHGQPGPSSHAGGKLSGALVLAAVVCLLILCSGILLPFMALVRSTHAASLRSQNKLKQIGLALINYSDAYGSLPPAYVADANGRPLYSWRVLILPYLDQDAIWQRWDHSKSWDSPENLPLSQIYLREYSADERPGACDYAVFMGPNTAFPGPKSVRLADVKDGLSSTIGVMEVRGVCRSWAEPADIPLAEKPTLDIVPAAQPGAVVSAVMLDGAVMMLGGNASLSSLATIAGGEAPFAPYPSRFGPSTQLKSSTHPTRVIPKDIPHAEPSAPAPAEPVPVEPVPVEPGTAVDAAPGRFPVSHF